jgi:voltage-gated sodium channel
MTRRILSALVHERVVMTAIVVNSIVLLLRGYEGWREKTDDALFAGDYALTAYFAVEIGIKVGLHGWRRFWKDGWNRFDFAIVASSAPMLILPLVNLEQLGVLLILRSVRILRLLRGFRFIPDRDRLWAGIRRALRASVGVFLALVVYNVILGLGANALFGELDPDHFGDPLISIYSMFKVFTVEGWFDLPDLIAAQSSAAMGWIVRGYFVLAVMTGGILGLSIANAVFVDEMVIDNTNHVEAHLDLAVQQLKASQEAQTELLREVAARLETLASRLGEWESPRRS